MSYPRPKILAIDDTPENLLTLGAVLAADFDLQIATSGAMGLKLAMASPPDLILVDVMMPGMDGFETCRRLKAELALKNTPVVFVTVMSEAESEIQGLTLGGADYITKPINVEIARQRIRNLLEREALRTKIEAQRDMLEVLLAERKQVEDELRISAVAFASQNGMMITNASGVILRVNPAFTRLTGYSAEEAVGQTPAMLKSGRQPPSFYQRMWELVREKGYWQGEIWNRRKSGLIYAEMLTITGIFASDGNISNYVASFTDITEDKEAEAEIHRLAYYDPLTRLPNRRLLHDRLGQAVAAAGRSCLYGVIFLIDLDNFKALNDTRGHDVGDLLLVEVARRLSAVVREGDTVARQGGDEFVVLAEGMAADIEEAAARAKQLGETLRDVANRPVLLHGYEYHCKFSIGVGLFQGHDSVEDLFKHADLALYQAKNAGRNGMRFFDPAMQAALDLRSTLEAELREAIHAQQLRLYYQPQVDASRRVVGAEALVRWQHPQRGLVPPNDFIPLAEDTGLILPMGHWVMETACRQLHAWANDARTRDLQVAVNVSARQFHQPDFVQQVLDVLQQTGAKPHLLKLELTESLLVSDVEDVIAKMGALKDIGVGFSLDDYGTGYSSLAYLSRLPLDQLKIDRSFVKGIETSETAVAICAATIGLAHNLKLKVVAEGVETEAQWHILSAQYKCDFVQGFLFSRPLPLGEFEASLVRNGRQWAQADALM